MQPWFMWKNQDSRSYGIWVSELPQITRAKERYEEIQIPGRAGSLTLKEGENVHESYMKECRITVRQDADIAFLLNWLTGSGLAVFSNEPMYAYEASIPSQVRFARDGNSFYVATVQFFVNPHKRRNPAESAFTPTNGGTIYNPGTVESKPLITITGTGDMALMLNSGATIQRFFSLPGLVTVDSEAELVLDEDGHIWNGTYDANFLRFEPGENVLSWTGIQDVLVEPRWRWF